MYDVIIIGSGVSGSAAARELSRYKAKVCVLEKEEDVCCGTSKANSGIVHAGYDAKEGSLMAKLNVRGNAMMEQLSKELDFPFQRVGSLVICLREEDMDKLQALYDRGVANGVPGLQILNREEVLEMEPNIVDNVYAALYAPSAGIVCPFGLNIAMAENACENGVEFKFDTKVQRLEKKDDIWEIHTNQGVFKTKYVVNAAGVYADKFHNMVSENKIHITARKGEYLFFDKSVGTIFNTTVVPLPGKMGKGIAASYTINGNFFIGPTATDVEDKEGLNTTAEILDKLKEMAASDGYLTRFPLPLNKVITSFAGARAHEDHHEFIVQELEDAPNFFDAAGIESPGLTSSPAIGERLAKIISEKMHLEKKETFNPKRAGFVRFNEISDEEREKLIEENPLYGNVICRCELVTEGQIVDAINRPIGARSVDAVKRRVRAGMGRCQGGFCSPKVMSILSRELGIDMTEVTKKGGNSQMVTGHVKE